MPLILTTLVRLARPRCGFIVLVLLAAPAVWADTPPTVTLVNQDISVRAGEEVRFAATISGPGTIAIQWYRQGALVEGGSSAELVIPHAAESDVGTYQVVAENEFGSTLGGGRVELTVTPAVEFTSQPSSLAVRVGESIALQAEAEGIEVVQHWLRGHVELPAQSDGSLLIESATFADSGIYQAVGVGTYGEGRSDRVRVQVLPATDPGVLQLDDDWVIPVERGGGNYDALAATSDGGFLLAGNFIRINGHDTRTVARFKADGTIDSEFVCQVDLVGDVNRIMEQPDGGILVAGHFRAATSTVSQWGIFRLHPDGLLDTTFRPAALFEHIIYDMDIDALGRIYVAAGPASTDRTSSVVRLSADGQHDPTFVQTSLAADRAEIGTIAVTPNGDVFAGTGRGLERTIYYFDGAGTLLRKTDLPTFEAINSLELDSAGQLYVHGREDFPAGGGWRRFTSDGVIDPTFSGNGTYTITHDSAILPDGGMLISSSLILQRVAPDSSTITTIATDGLAEQTRVIVDALGRPVYFKSDWTEDDPRLVLRRFESDFSASIEPVSSVASRGGISSIIDRGEDGFLVLGDFDFIAGQPQSFSAMISREGVLDLERMAGVFNGPVAEAVEDAAGSVYVMGDFTNAFGSSSNGLVRLRADLSIDSQFKPAAGTPGVSDFTPYRTLGPLSDGTLTLSAHVDLDDGEFNRTSLAKLTDAGEVVISFRPRWEDWTNVFGAEQTIEMLDGRIVVMAGYGLPYSTAWLNPDGSFSGSAVLTRSVYPGNGGISVDLHERIWLFTSQDITRYNRAAEADPDFTRPAAVVDYTLGEPELVGLIPQANDALIVLGDMSFRDPASGRERRDFAARFRADGSLDERFEIKGLGSPVHAVIALEDGNFLIGTNGELRRTTPLQAPEVHLRAPLTVTSETPLRLDAVVTGYADSFQWYRNGVRIPGATEPVLEIAEAQMGDTAIYSVVARNDQGADASEPHELTVLDGQSHAGGVHRAAFPMSHVDDDTLLQVVGRVRYTGSPTEITWSALLPEGWALRPISGDPADSSPADLVTGLAEWTWQNPSDGKLQIYYDLVPPADAIGRWEFPAYFTVTTAGEVFESLAQPDPLVMRLVGDALHSADSDGDLSIDLSELLRVIELYNTRSGTSRTGRYRLNARSADGFDADLEDGAFGEVAVFHSADFDRDARISLSELLRVIELYNVRSGTTRTGRYKVDEVSPDGFAPDLD